MSTSVAPYPRRSTSTDDGQRIWNWARNSVIAPSAAVVRPTTEAQLREAIASSTGRVRLTGSRMSAGRMLELAGAGDRLLDTTGLRGLLTTGEDSVTFAGGTPLQEVYDVLTAMGRMLPSSPGVIASQTLAGALATGTHGQGLRQSSIGDAVLDARLVLADGSVAEFDRDHPSFPAVQLGLGLLGAVSAVTLRTVPSLVYTCAKEAVSAGDLGPGCRPGTATAPSPRRGGSPTRTWFTSGRRGRRTRRSGASTRAVADASWSAGAPATP